MFGREDSGYFSRTIQAAIVIVPFGLLSQDAATTGDVRAVRARQDCSNFSSGRNHKAAAIATKLPHNLCYAQALLLDAPNLNAFCSGLKEDFMRDEFFQHAAVCRIGELADVRIEPAEGAFQPLRMPAWRARTAGSQNKEAALAHCRGNQKLRQALPRAISRHIHLSLAHTGQHV